MALMAEMYINVPSVTLGAGGTGKQNLGLEYTLNCTFVNGGGGTATLSLWDSRGTRKDYQIASGNPAIVKRASVMAYQITGAGVSIAGVLSWPDEVDPSSIAVSGPVTISGTVDTNLKDVGGNATSTASAGLQSVAVVSNGGLDPTNPTQTPIGVSPSLLTYTVPAGYKLLLNSVIGTIQNGATAGRVTSANSGSTITMAGSSGGAVVLAKDTTGGALGASKLYALAAYEAGGGAVGTVPTVVADVGFAFTMTYPQTLVAGDQIAFAFAYTGGTDAIQTLSIQGLLTPL